MLRTRHAVDKGINKAKKKSQLSIERNENKTFPLGKKEERTVERGKFANYAHLSLIILYSVPPSPLSSLPRPSLQ